MSFRPPTTKTITTTTIKTTKYMKKLVLSAVAVLASSFAYGQNMAVYKAEEQFNEEKFVEAEKTIIPALTNPKTKKLDYAYNLAGKIESRLLQKEIEKAS